MSLEIYTDALQLTREMRDVVTKIAQSDADLGKQLRRALTSVPLNIAEGEWRRNGNARARFETAMGSANEVRAILETADAMGYVAADARQVDVLDRIARTLHKLV